MTGEDRRNQSVGKCHVYRITDPPHARDRSGRTIKRLPVCYDAIHADARVAAFLPCSAGLLSALPYIPLQQTGR